MSKSTRYSVLIICEGANTEPFFFNSIRDRIINKVIDIGDIEIKIRPEPKIENTTVPKSKDKSKRKKRELKPGKQPTEDICGIPPEKWVLAAQKELKDGTFDEVWAVFDHDNHPNRKEAFDLAEKEINGKCVQIAFSSMSFEYYLLLHFEKIYKSFDKSECREPKNKMTPNPKSYDCGMHTHNNDCDGEKCIVGYMREMNYIIESTKDEYSVYNLIGDSLHRGFINAAWLRYKSDKEDFNMPIYNRNPYVTTDRIVTRLLTGNVVNYVYVGAGEVYKLDKKNIIQADRDCVRISNLDSKAFLVQENSFQFVDETGNRENWENANIIIPPKDEVTIAIPENLKNRDGNIIFNCNDYQIILERNSVKAPIKKSLRIVFMGTPEFATESLRALVEGGYNVVGVITMPDKPVGKSHSLLTPSPIKEYALSKNLPLLQPEKLKDSDFVDALKAWNADLQIVVAFRILPEIVWNMPRLGTFNLHASLLPQYRGAAPINWAIINGETETGITTFFLTHEIDTGKIISQEKVEIKDTDNAEIIHDQLMALGASLVIRTVDDILTDSVRPISQKELLANNQNVELKSAPKIFKETCKIDWTRSVKEVYDFIRGLSPYPAAWTELKTTKNEPVQMKIFESEKRFIQHNLQPGTVVSDGKNHLDVAVFDGYVRLLNIQQSGKKRMPVVEFLKGHGALFVNERNERMNG